MSNATLRYHLSLAGTNLSGKAIQKTYEGSKYIYALVRDKRDSVIYRALIPTSENVVNFNEQDHMRLQEFGHGQTLEWYSHNNQSYFLVVGKATDTDKNFGVQIGRIKYEQNMTKPYNYTKMTRLSNVGSILTSGQTLYRCEAALSSDRSSMVLYADPLESRMSRLALFDFNKLNNALDSVDNSSKNYISLGSSKIQNTMIKPPFNVDVKYELHGSMQGIELSNGNSVYITSGQISSQPYLVKIGWNKTSLKNDKIMLPDVVGNDNIETEAPQLSGNNLFINIVDRKGGSTKNKLYSLDK